MISLWNDFSRQKREGIQEYTVFNEFQNYIIIQGISRVSQLMYASVFLQVWISPNSQRVEWVCWIFVHWHAWMENTKSVCKSWTVSHFFLCEWKPQFVSQKGEVVFSNLPISRIEVNLTLSELSSCRTSSVRSFFCRLWASTKGFVFVCVRTDGENNRRTSSGGLTVQPRHDELRCVPARRQPERGGEAAVEVSGSKLDTLSVSHCQPPAPS